MKKMRSIGIIFFTGMLALGWGCQKKGDFIDEDKLGSGIYYYPLILNEEYYDTLTHKRFSDTTFSPGQKVIFELKYFSKDSIDRIELWASELGKERQKIWSTPYKSTYYSTTQKCDTTFINCNLPILSDTTRSDIILSPVVITREGLTGTSQFKIEIE